MKIIFLILLSTSLFGIRNNTIYENGMLTFSTGNLHEIREDVENSVRDYLNDIKTELGYESSHEYPLLKQNTGFGYSEHLVFQQTKNGIPVFGKTIRVHINHKEIISSISSNIQSIDISTIPSFSKIDAMTLLKNELPFSKKSYLKYKELLIYIMNGVPHLVYSIESISFEKSWNYFVDAHSNQIIDQFPLTFDEGPTTGSGINLLDESVDLLHIYEGESFTPFGNLATPYLLCDEYCFDYGDCDGQNYWGCTVTASQGDCLEGELEDCNGNCFSEWYMQFPGVGNGFCNDPWIHIDDSQLSMGMYNMVDESQPELGTIYTLNSYGGFYDELSYVNSPSSVFESASITNSHQSGVSAHDYQRKTLDYFWDYHNYAGIDGAGKRTISVVNYFSTSSISQRNAFYNAALDILTYGYGGNGYRPFCAAQDIVTHEFSHGFTAHTSGLIYRNQAGAMNESISDVMGYFVEAVYQDGGDWTEGEDVRYSGEGGRSFIHPPSHQQPDHVNHYYFVDYNPNPLWSNDFGGVHTNSGIPNKIMYLVIQGDEHYDIIVEPFESDIVQSRIVASNIWFAWNSFYLDKEDDFEIGREKMLQACYDLYPNRLDYYQTVSNAWASTGIGNPILSGDVNDDQVVNIQDIIIMINIIMGNWDASETQLILGDINSDGIIDILDIVGVVNIIMN